MGSLSALGAMPKCMLQPQLNDVLAMLMRQSLKPDRIAAVLGVVNAAGGGEHLPSHLTTWAEARRDSVKALSAVVDTIGFAADDGGDETTSINPHIDDIFACLLSALQEYTIDDRGDIGAWVREAAMNGIMVSIHFCNHFIISFRRLALFRLVTMCPPSLLRPNIVHDVMVGFAQQAVEIIDRTRGLAGSLFCKLVYQ